MPSNEKYTVTFASRGYSVDHSSESDSLDIFSNKFTHSSNYCGMSDLPTSDVEHKTKMILFALFIPLALASPCTFVPVKTNVNLTDLALNVSTPHNPLYRHFLSAEEIEQLTKVSDTKLNKVVKWISNISTEFDVTKHSDAVVVCAANISLHARLVDEFRKQSPDFIDDFVESHPLMKQPGRLSSHHYASGGAVTKEVIDRLYNVPNSSRSFGIGPIEFQSFNGFKNSDLSVSQKANGLRPNVVPKSRFIGQRLDIVDDESALDIQMIGTTAYNDELWYENWNGWMYSWALDFSTRANIPYVVSLSWGWSERDQCFVIQCRNRSAAANRAYVKRTNYEFLKLALRGVSVVVASGDAGSPGRTNEMCTNIQSQNRINPIFPASSPWVTSVGASFLLESSNKVDWKTPVCRKFQCSPSTQASLVTFDDVGWTSGAGFSLWDYTGPWQYDAVQEFLNSSAYKPPIAYWNRFGRAYPDVVVIGQNCFTFIDGFFQKLGGTSCSAPLFASFVSILNAKERQLGRPPLGFLNPFLYEAKRARPATFQSSTSGNSSCTEDECCNAGFGFSGSSTQWSPTAGLGFPNVAELSDFSRSLS